MHIMDMQKGGGFSQMVVDGMCTNGGVCALIGGGGGEGGYAQNLRAEFVETAPHKSAK